MAKFSPISVHDTQETRKQFDLPITKSLRYMSKTDGVWHETCVIDYVPVTEYLPSKTPSLLITLEEGDKIRILGPYFAQMQKPSFVEDMETQTEIV